MYIERCVFIYLFGVCFCGGGKCIIIIYFYVFSFIFGVGVIFFVVSLCVGVFFLILDMVFFVWQAVRSAIEVVLWRRFKKWWKGVKSQQVTQQTCCWYCWWKKSCTTWDVKKNPVNNGIFITISAGKRRISAINNMNFTKHGCNRQAWRMICQGSDCRAWANGFGFNKLFSCLLSKETLMILYYFAR